MYMRLCAAHSGTWATWDTSSTFHCPGYKRDLANAKFDPKPYEVGGNNQDQSVKIPDSSSEWVVLSRNGDTLTIRPLGRRNFEPREISVGECSPARYIPPSKNRCSE